MVEPLRIIPPLFLYLSFEEIVCSHNDFQVVASSSSSSSKSAAPLSANIRNNFESLSAS